MRSFQQVVQDCEGDFHGREPLIGVMELETSKKRFFFESWVTWVLRFYRDGSLLTIG